MGVFLWARHPCSVNRIYLCESCDSAAQKQALSLSLPLSAPFYFLERERFLAEPPFGAASSTQRGALGAPFATQAGLPSVAAPLATAADRGVFMWKYSLCISLVSMKFATRLLSCH